MHQSLLIYNLLGSIKDPCPVFIFQEVFIQTLKSIILEEHQKEDLALAIGRQVSKGPSIISKASSFHIPILERQGAEHMGHPPYNCQRAEMASPKILILQPKRRSSLDSTLKSSHNLSLRRIGGSNPGRSISTT